MKNTINSILTYIFHPSLVFIYGLAMIFFLLPLYTDILPLRFVLVFMLSNLVFTLVVPLLILLTLKRSGRITSLHMEERAERIVPFILISGCFIFNYFQYTRLGIPGILTPYALAAASVIIACTLLTIQFKISAHAAGMGAVAGLLISIGINLGIDIRIVLAFWLVISGAVLQARLALNAHNQIEIWSGFFVGAIITALICTPDLLVI